MVNSALEYVCLVPVVIPSVEMHLVLPSPCACISINTSSEDYLDPVVLQFLINGKHEETAFLPRFAPCHSLPSWLRRLMHGLHKRLFAKLPDEAEIQTYQVGTERCAVQFGVEYKH